MPANDSNSSLACLLLSLQRLPLDTLRDALAAVRADGPNLPSVLAGAGLVSRAELEQFFMPALAGIESAPPADWSTLELEDCTFTGNRGQPGVDIFLADPDIKGADRWPRENTLDRKGIIVSDR